MSRPAMKNRRKALQISLSSLLPPSGRGGRP
jgi:hypothetical protein